MFGINELGIPQFPNSVLFNAPKKTFAATVNDIPATGDKQTNQVRWYSSTNSYWTSWGDSQGSSKTCGDCDTVAKYLDTSIVKQALADGQGFTFLSIGPNDTWEDGTTDDHKCPDTNRKTHEDGNCTDECKEGYVFKEEYVAGRDFFEPGQCVKETNCGVKNREDNDGLTCGECVSGYSDDGEGNCKEDTNWLLYGGIAAALGIGALVVGLR